MSDLVFSPQAQQDLIEIWDFIAQDDIDAADRVCDDIEQRMNLMCSIDLRYVGQEHTVSLPLSAPYSAGHLAHQLQNVGLLSDPAKGLSANKSFGYEEVEHL